MGTLTISGLRTTFHTDQGPVGAVDGVSLDLAPGRVLGVVGESGCGKSALALSVMGLLPVGATMTGSIRLGGHELVGMPPNVLRALRGAEMAMVFQDPMSSLNPLMTVGRQLEEAVRVHRAVSRREARRLASDALARVGLAQPGERLRAYPFEMSGGMRQRVMIAMALINRPRLLIADEPTTALDVTTQAQVLQVIRDLCAEVGAAVLLVTHDLGVAAATCDEVAVMYAGRIVEQAPVDLIFVRPQHPYTWGLLQSIPGRWGVGEGEGLHQIAGAPPGLMHPPAGCRFAPRCGFALDACRHDPPPHLSGPGSSRAACHLDSATRAREGARVAAGCAR